MKPQLDRRLSILCGCAATLLLLFIPSATLRAAPGDLDPTFGIGGILINGFGSSLGVSQTAVAMALQSDGKIVVVG